MMRIKNYLAFSVSAELFSFIIGPIIIDYFSLNLSEMILVFSLLFIAVITFSSEHNIITDCITGILFASFLLSALFVIGFLSIYCFVGWSGAPKSYLDEQVYQLYYIGFGFVVGMFGFVAVFGRQKEQGE